VAGKVFLSYAREDLEMVRWEAQTMLMLGHEVFLDVNSLRAGDDWPATLVDEIRTAERFILFWSAFSARSEWVRREYTEALAVNAGRQAAGNGTPYLQIIRLDKEPLHDSLAHIQAIDRSIEERVVVVTEEAQRSFLSGGLEGLIGVGTLLHMQAATPRTVRVVAQKAEAALLSAPSGEAHHFRAETGLPAKFAFPVYRRRGGVRTVIFLPGLFGSHLSQQGRRIWMDVMALMTGRISRLAIGKPGVVAESVLQLGSQVFIQQMGLTARVMPWPYDWRLSVEDVAADLARRLQDLLTAEPDCELVFAGFGHGCAALRALAAYHPALWKEARPRGAPVVFVAPHEHGSWAVAEILLGRSDFADKLGLLDLWHSSKEIHDLFAGFPSLLEILPSSAAEDLFDASWWTGKPYRPRDLALAEARRIRQTILKAIDPAEILCVVGHAKSTVASIRMDDGRLIKVTTPMGDGIAPWSLGVVPGVKAYQAGRPAGEILGDPLVVRAIGDLIDHGATSLLPRAGALK
jgi:hypothetical protein